METVSEVEEGPITLVLSVTEWSFDIDVYAVIIKNSIVVGREDIALLVDMYS